MKPDIRWQLLLAVVCVGLVFSIIGFQYQSTGLCSVEMPAAGGRLVEGLVGQPQLLNPLFSGENDIDQELIDLIFDGLTRYGDAGELEPALASSWSIGEDQKRITFNLREDVLWHDDESFTSDDIVFTYGLLQNEDVSASEKLKALWRGVEIQAVDQHTVEFILPEPYSPFLEATTIPILPAHILGKTEAADLADHEFNYRPIGTGPFVASQVNDWRRTGFVRLAPNPVYWRQGTMLDGVDIRFFANSEDLGEAFENGDIQAVSRVSNEVSELAQLSGLKLFTHPEYRFTQLLFNLSDSGSQAIRELAVREALVRAIDKESLIDRAISGQGIPFDGPYLPSNWVYNPGILTNREFDPLNAEEILSNAGWQSSGLGSIRQKDEQPFEFRLVYLDDNRTDAVANEIAEQWRAIGANAILIPASGDELQELLSIREFDAAIVDIEPQGDPDLYDFWSQEAIVRGQNFSGWNNRWASEALEAGRQTSNYDERKSHYERFLMLYDQDLPALTLYQHVASYGISDSVEEVEIGKISSPRDRYESFENWFFFYRDVSVACPSEEL